MICSKSRYHTKFVFPNQPSGKRSVTFQRYEVNTSIEHNNEHNNCEMNFATLMRIILEIT